MKIIELIKKFGKVILGCISVLMTFVVGAILYLSVGKINKSRKEKQYENKINDLEREKAKDEKIIINSSYDDYDDHGIRRRK